MSNTLCSFVLATLQPHLNNPQNSQLWLPNALANLPSPNGPGKLLPFNDTNWDLGALGGSGGATIAEGIANAWYQLLPKPDPNHPAIPCPADPYPHLGMPQVTINGLNNMFVMPGPAVTALPTGYGVVATLQVGYYNGQGGLPNLSQLELTGTYTLTQEVCCAQSPKVNACDPKQPSDTVQGTGTFDITLTNLFVDASLSLLIGGTGGQRSFQLQANSATLRGPNSGGQQQLPTITVNNLTIDGSSTPLNKMIWINSATEALTNADGVSAIIANINGSLNQPSNLAQLANMLGSQFSTLLDNVFGTVGADGLPSDAGQAALNPADLYVFDRFRYGVNLPSSGLYLPQGIANLTNPALEPYCAGTVSLGSPSQDGITLQNLELTNVVVTGLANVVAPAAQQVLNLSVVNGSLTFSSLPGGGVVPQPPLTITAGFNFSLVGNPVSGSLSATIQPSSVSAQIALGGADISSLVTTFQNLVFSADTQSPTAMQITVQIQSVFAQIINEIFNQPSTKQSILSGLNQAISGQLSSLSTSAAQEIAALVNAKLGP